MSIRIKTVSASQGTNWFKSAFKTFCLAPHLILMPFFSVILIMMLMLLISLMLANISIYLLFPLMAVATYYIVQKVVTNKNSNKTALSIYQETIINSKNKLQKLLILGLLYLLVNVLFTALLSFTLPDTFNQLQVHSHHGHEHHTAQDHPILDNNSDKDTESNINQLLNIPSYAIAILLVIVICSFIAQIIFSSAAIFSYSMNISAMQAIFYAGYLFSKNWRAFTIFLVSLFSLMVLAAIIISLILTTLSALAPFVLILSILITVGITLSSSYFYLQDCVIFD